MPGELRLGIMDPAEYNVAEGRSLPIAHDPLHPENKDALEEYLIYCWLTLVRCNMFAQAIGMTLNWKAEVILSLERIMGVPPGKALWKEEGTSVQDLPVVGADPERPCRLHFQNKHGQT
ncbi:hypothetical protein BDV19DRAFT_385327 [Aspergillus venezuelensis]